LAVSTIGLWVVTSRGVKNQTLDTRILQRDYISVEPGGISVSNDPKKCHPDISEPSTYVALGAPTMILIARAVVTHQTKQNGARHVWADVAGLRPQDRYRRPPCPGVRHAGALHEGAPDLAKFGISRRQSPGH